MPKKDTLLLKLNGGWAIDLMIRNNYDKMILNLRVLIDCKICDKSIDTTIRELNKGIRTGRLFEHVKKVKEGKILCGYCSSKCKKIEKLKE